MSDVSPLDVLGKQFRRALRGYDPQQVQEFHGQVASALENLLRERGEQRLQMRRLENELAEFRRRENALQEALVAAQRSVETTLEEARLQSQRIVAEAQTLAERLVDDAAQRAATIEKVIADLRTRRREVRAEVMRLVELLQGLIRDDQSLERQERSSASLTLLHRRIADGGAEG